MRVLLTGAGGFAGPHVVQALADRGHTIHTVDRTKSVLTEISVDVHKHAVDLCDSKVVGELLLDVRPEACIHLAGLAFVPDAEAYPLRALELNTKMSWALLEQLRDVVPECKTLLVSSAEVYGRKDRGHLVKEDERLAPENTYGISKMAVDLEGLHCFEKYAQHVMVARPQNHIGPGQSKRFVATSFAAQLLAIRAGTQEGLHVGNLEVQRDFTDVRDVARAYVLLIEKGYAGQAYNIASGTLKPISFLLEQLKSMIDVEVEAQLDAARYRPTDQLLQLDTTHIKEHVGWEPQISLEQSLRDIVASLEETYMKLS